MLDYGADYADLVPFLQSLVPVGGTGTATLTAESSGPSFELAAYQQAMKKRYSRLKLEELDPTTHDARALHLTGMFIEQSARECIEFLPRVFELPKELQQKFCASGELEGAELDEQILKEHRQRYLDQSRRPILAFVRDHDFARLVVLGDPGSGKSTLLKYLLLMWAEKPAPDMTREPLPLLIELREYATQRHRGEVAGYLDYLHAGAGVRWHFERQQLDDWLRTNPSLVLFDGLDEVFDPELRKEVSTAIHRFADDYPLARVIVSSRIIGFQHQSWRDEGFRHLMLQELDAVQVTDFLDRWHQRAYDEPAKGEAKRALLARAVEDSAAIRQLAGNPLLLTMMAMLNRTQDLPRDRAELYEQCARLLLHQWKVDLAFDAVPELANASLDFKDKRGLMLRVARAMQDSEGGLAGNLISEDVLEAALAEGLAGMPNLRPDWAARALIEQLCGHNFMLCSMGGRSYAFVHRTFLEYFCAVEIRERFQAKQSLSLEQLKSDVFGHWDDEVWHEVLCLLAGMLDPQFVAECLMWLLQQPDLQQCCRHIFLAARCVGEVRKRAELGTVDDTVRQAIAATIWFELNRNDELGPDVEDIARDVRNRAVALLASVWKTSATHDWLKDLALNDAHWAVRQAAMQALARGWRDDSETLPWLKDRARNDLNLDVRHAAVRELARSWRDDPETLPLLKDCAQNDANWVIRHVAVRELARGWRDDADVRAFLESLAKNR